MPVTSWSLKFHSRCGNHISFGAGNTTVRREGDTYDHGLVFSHRPLHVGEIFQLKIEDIEPKWAGSLRLGVTTENPNCPSTKVVRAVTDLFSEETKNYWILSGCHLHYGGHEKLYKLNLHSLTINNRIGVQICYNGDLHFYENGRDKGVAVSNIPINKDIYAVFDVYGKTKEVSWSSFDVSLLQDLCRDVILKILSDTEIECLPLPQHMIQYLKG